MNKNKQGIVLGKDRFGRGVLLTPEGEYRRVFIPRDAQQGDIVFYGTDPFFGKIPALRLALAGAFAVLLVAFGWFAVRHFADRTAQRVWPPNPPVGVVYATLYLGSKYGDPVALDLDRQGRIVTIRKNGMKLARQKAIGHSVSDALKHKDRLLAGIKIEPGEPLGLRVYVPEREEIPARKGDQVRSMETGGTSDAGGPRAAGSANPIFVPDYRQENIRILPNNGTGGFLPPGER